MKDQYIPLHPRLKELYEVYFLSNLKATNCYIFPSRKVSNQPLGASDIRNKLCKAAEYAGVSVAITSHTLLHYTTMSLSV